MSKKIKIREHKKYTYSSGIKLEEIPKLSRNEIRKLKPGESYINKKGNFARKNTRKESIENFFYLLLGWIIYPFYHSFVFIWKILYGIFMTKSNFRDNGIIGPGYHSSYETHFNWGKLSFILIVLFIITYLIFIR